MSIFRKTKKETRSEIDFLNNSQNDLGFTRRYTLTSSWPFLRKLTEEEIQMKRQKDIETCKQILREMEERERLEKEKSKN